MKIRKRKKMAQSKCPHCHGTGMTIIWGFNAPVIVDCGYCNGTGEAKGD